MDAKSLGGAVSLEKIFQNRENVHFAVSWAHLARVDHVNDMAKSLLVPGRPTGATCTGTDRLDPQ